MVDDGKIERLATVRLPQVDEGIAALKERGAFTQEFSNADVASLMREVVASISGPDKAVKKITFEFLEVAISRGQAAIMSKFTAETKFGNFPVSVSLTLGNILKDGKPSGKIVTEKFSVSVSTLLPGVNSTVTSAVENLIGGTKINDTFQREIGKAAEAQGAFVSEISLAFTAANTLRLEVKGGEAVKKAA